MTAVILMKNWIMRIPDAIPFGLTRRVAIVRAIVRASLVNKPAGGNVETVLTLLTQRLLLRAGGFLRADVILWATGFRAALDHLAPLHLRTHGGGIVMEGTQVAAEPRVHLIGYGPSSSTIGANRAGRAAVASLATWLEAAPRAVQPAERPT